jgi:hypothetical protein
MWLAAFWLVSAVMVGERVLARRREKPLGT